MTAGSEEDIFADVHAEISVSCIRHIAKISTVDSYLKLVSSKAGAKLLSSCPDSDRPTNFSVKGSWLAISQLRLFLNEHLFDLNKCQNGTGASDKERITTIPNPIILTNSNNNDISSEVTQTSQSVDKTENYKLETETFTNILKSNEKVCQSNNKIKEEESSLQDLVVYPVENSDLSSSADVQEKSDPKEITNVPRKSKLKPPTRRSKRPNLKSKERHSVKSKKSDKLSENDSNSSAEFSLPIIPSSPSSLDLHELKTKRGRLKKPNKIHTEPQNCCDICGKLYRSKRTLAEHRKTHDDNYEKPEFQCDLCNKSFSTKYVLANHVKSEHLGKKRSYLCPTCGKSFSQKHSYLQHANVHLGIKPFSCNMCEKSFAYEKSLKEHKFMHDNIRRFKCDYCEKSFRQSSALAVHLKIHKEQKDYVCSACGKGFSQNQALKRHERIHVGDKPFVCNLCQRPFTDSSVLRRHMILIHKKDPKKWREDTISLVKKTQYFIDVVNDDGGTENSHVVADEKELKNINLSVPNIVGSCSAENTCPVETTLTATTSALDLENTKDSKNSLSVVSFQQNPPDDSMTCQTVTVYSNAYANQYQLMSQTPVSLHNLETLQPSQALQYYQHVEQNKLTVYDTSTNNL